ncbi:hypothetical protein F4859DRAFT_309044 [Xylaria cf. heliscus]|nr:hypothetical protein F4859DRAFT_309044 [Xylaria cf. heliscus]
MAETDSVPDQQHPASASAHASASTSAPASASASTSASASASKAKGSPSPSSSSSSSSLSSPSPLPRVTIRFCTQCKWMLRAAYFAQELLSTFSTSLGEVALQPATGGIFVVEIFYADPTPISISTATATTTQADANPTIQHRVLWDRKVDGGFPETKELKRRVRDVIEPERNLGHVDRDYPRQQQPQKDKNTTQQNASGKDATSEAKQQGQPLGPRWSQPNEPDSSQPAVQGQQTVPDPSQTGSQSKALGTDGPVHDRMPGGGIMPLVPPVSHDYSSNIQHPPSQVPLQTRKPREECEDCQ